MSTLDMIITVTPCPRCGPFPLHFLRAWVVPSGYDEDGHAHEVEVDTVECPGCHWEPGEDDPIWERLEGVMCQLHSSARIVEVGRIFQELGTVDKSAPQW